MDAAQVGQAMLNAAQAAAGNTWNTIQHDFASDLKGVLQSAATIEAQLAANQITQAEAEVLLRNQSALLFILSQEVELDAEIVVQNAVNAAIDVLWTAVKSAAGVP